MENENQFDELKTVKEIEDALEKMQKVLGQYGNEQLTPEEMTQLEAILGKDNVPTTRMAASQIVEKLEEKRDGMINDLSSVEKIDQAIEKMEPMADASETLTSGEIIKLYTIFGYADVPQTRSELDTKTEERINTLKRLDALTRQMDAMRSRFDRLTSAEIAQLEADAFGAGNFPKTLDEFEKKLKELITEKNDLESDDKSEKLRQIRNEISNRVTELTDDEKLQLQELLGKENAPKDRAGVAQFIMQLNMKREEMTKDLSNIESLDFLMGKLKSSEMLIASQQAQIDSLKSMIGNLSLNKQLTPEEMKQLEEMFGKGNVPKSQAEIQEKIDTLVARKQETEEMTAPYIEEAKKRVVAVRDASEAKFNEAILASSRKRTDFDARESRFIVEEASKAGGLDPKEDEETVRKQIEEKARAMKEKVKAKVLSSSSGKSAEEIQKMILDEFAKIDAVTAKSLEKLSSRTLSSKAETENAELVNNQIALRTKLNKYEQQLNTPELMLEDAEKPGKNAMQIYDSAKALRGELEAQLQTKQKRIAEIEAELAKGDNPDLAKEKAELETQLGEINNQIKLCNDKIDEVKGKMSPEDRAKVEEIEKAEAEAAKKKKEEEEREGGEGSGEGEKGGKKGDKTPLKITGAEYYESLGRWGKYKLKKQAYMIDEGKSAGDVSLIRKLLLLLPSKRYSSLAQGMLDYGDIQMDKDQVSAVLKAKEEMQSETQPKEQPAKPEEQREESAGDTYWSPEQKEAVAAWGALSDEEKSKVNENIRVVLDRMAQAQKGAEGQPQPKQPSKEPEK